MWTYQLGNKCVHKFVLLCQVISDSNLLVLFGIPLETFMVYYLEHLGTMTALLMAAMMFLGWGWFGSFCSCQCLPLVWIKEKTGKQAGQNH